MAALLDEPLNWIRRTAGRVLRRQPAPAHRVIRARRENATTTTENRNQWIGADGLSADSSLNPAVRRELRNRARYEACNDSYCAGMIESLCNDCIGTGPTLQVKLDDPDTNARVETAFHDWCSTIDLAGKLWTMRYAKAVDGEAFATLFTNPRLAHPVRLDLRLVEADQIADPLLGLNGSRDTDGIVLDDFGNVAAYTLLIEHPGASTGLAGLRYVTVPARDMIHLFKQVRPGQHRGAPEIEPALGTFSRRRSYTKAVGMSAESAASISWIVETDNQPGEEGDPDDAPEAFDVLETVRGKGLVLPSRAKMNQLKAEQPTSTVDMMVRVLIAEQARCLNQPFNVAANDSSGYNFSSAKLDHRQYYRIIGRERAVFFEAKCCTRIFAAWWKEARLIPGYLPPRGRAALPPIEWRWDSAPAIDELKESQAKQIRLSIPGLSTLADECATEGKDWETQLQQRAIELARMRELGFPVAFGVPLDAASPADDPEDTEQDTGTEETDSEETGE